jgi:hypothetical protein
MNFKERIGFPCIIILVSLFVYSNSFEGAFLYDDIHSIVLNPHLKNQENWLKYFWVPEMGSGLVKQTSGYRPLLLFSYALNFWVGGGDAFGYHLVNLMIHIGCALFIL